MRTQKAFDASYSHFSFPLQTTCPNPFANDPKASRLLMIAAGEEAEAVAEAAAPWARPLRVEGTTLSTDEEEAT